MAPLPWPERVRLWDAVLQTVRDTSRGRGLREVSTPVRVEAPAIEPYIEPIPAPPGYLATSPELAMKRLLCRGSGSIFQLAHCFRRSERGRLHNEEFHLLEWYRCDADESATMADVEAIADAVFEAAARVRGLEPPSPLSWTKVPILEAVERTTGLALRGDEDAGELRATLGERAPELCPLPLASQAERLATESDEIATLEAWTAFFSRVSDAYLDPWLQQRPGGVHVTDFPVALAALARIDRPLLDRSRARLGRRFESAIAGIELANGYFELRDGSEQRRRFEVVAGLRRSLDLVPLPLDETFVRELDELGLPQCSGVALGLDRLTMLAADRDSLADISPFLGGV